MEMADICLEETQLKIVLKAVKNKQRRIKDEKNLEKFNKMFDFVEKEDSKMKNMNNMKYFFPKNLLLQYPAMWIWDWRQ